MRHKQFKVTTLAAALALSFAATSMAGVPTPGSGGGGTPSKDEVEANSDTTISILESTTKNANISYTVPLYVTLAVVSNQAAVKVPDNYAIANTTAPETEGSLDTVPKIGVTNMSIERLSTEAFKTVESTPAASDAKQIKLSIGGEVMPAVSDVHVVHSFTPKGTIFMSGGKPVGLTGTTKLPIEATVATVARTDKATAAQFRVKYTVSLLNASGEALGAVYAGDDRTAAGLPAFK